MGLGGLRGDRDNVLGFGLVVYIICKNSYNYKEVVKVIIFLFCGYVSLKIYL